MEKENKNLEQIRHSLSHIMMQVLERDFGAIPGVGPAIENGWYHDFESKTKITENDLKKIKKAMIKIINQDFPFEKQVMPIDKGVKFLEDKKYKYTAELARDLKKQGETEISFYQQGEFINMCKGPHLESTGKINPKAFKLTSLAGAYWKGDEKNPMLQRIYGIAFKTPEELADYEKMLEEAKKRDHRKIGKEMDLFVFSDYVGAGLPLFTPNGTALIDALQARVEKICRIYGFQKVLTPHLAKEKLFITSGHAGKYGDENFKVSSGKGHEFYLKPVQCPHQTQIYASQPRSYRDLPIRYMESNKQYRAEQSGEIGGLRRVYAITVEDGHSFCTPEQIRDEVKGMINIIKDFYTSIGLWDKFWVSLSVRGKENRDKYIGSEKNWDIAENMLADICEEMDLNATRMEGEAAIYGPKIDFQFKDVFGREIQIPTVQLDFATPERFKLEYVDQNGEKKAPVMIHRAILGSYERFLVMLIESTGGKFPFWMAPIQVKVIPVAESHQEYAQEIFKKLKTEDFRAEIDTSHNSFGKKIREAKKMKLPYFIIVGDKDIAENKLTLESRDTGESIQISLDELLEKFRSESK